MHASRCVSPTRGPASGPHPAARDIPIIPTTQVTLKVIDRESGFYELKKIKFTNSSEFYKRQLNFILKFGPLILTEKLQSRSFAVTETLNGDNCMTSLPLWVKQACAKSENLPTQKKSYPTYTLTMSY